MAENNSRPQAASEDDDIRTALAPSGANSVTLDRLAQVASDMTQLEWKLLRSKAKAAGVGGDTTPA